jgi:hypothetical protein
MILVKTKNGARFLNEKKTVAVEHDRTKALVIVYGANGLFHRFENVEEVLYTNDAEPTSWTDEGSEVQKLKAEVKAEANARNQAWEHFDYMRECFYICRNAVMWIADELDSKAEPSSKVAAIRLFVQETEKKYNEAVARFEDLKQRREDDGLRTTEGSEGEMPE